MTIPMPQPTTAAMSEKLVSIRWAESKGTVYVVIRIQGPSLGRHIWMTFPDFVAFTKACVGHLCEQATDGWIAAEIAEKASPITEP